MSLKSQSLVLVTLIVAMAAVTPVGGHAATTANAGAVMLPGSAASGPFKEAVLFSFDEDAFPFKQFVETRLYSGHKEGIVVPPGAPGSHDEAILYYGSVIRIGDTFHMWYNGNYGPFDWLPGTERKFCVISYATSKDGVHWVKPDLGLVEFNGSKHNNIVDLPVPALWSTFAVVHDPEDPDPSRRFKVAFEANVDGKGLKFCVAFSADGLHWTPSPHNPIGAFLEMAGVTKRDGLFYVTGQNSLVAYHNLPIRRLATFVSADFEHWSPMGALGLDRGPDASGPSTDGRWNEWEEVHLGAALWNRGNVILGIYGQWHASQTGDRGFTSIDLGLALTHDGLHYKEPIKDFRFIPAREQPGRPTGVLPALQQGQGMENFGDKTLFWYGLWRGNTGGGVRLITWPRDRLGALVAFQTDNPRAMSCGVQVKSEGVKAYLNIAGLGENAHVRVSLLDYGFQPLPGYSGDDAAVVKENGLRVPLAWKNGAGLPVTQRPFHIRVEYGGVRPEDIRFYAVYVGDSEQ